MLSFNELLAGMRGIHRGGKVREPAIFSEANNCKDPRYR
jgi:hypothetical protein